MQRKVGPTSNVRSTLPTCPYLPGPDLVPKQGWNFYPCTPGKRGKHLLGKGGENVMNYIFYPLLEKALGACGEFEYNYSKAY